MTGERRGISIHGSELVACPENHLESSPPFDLRRLSLRQEELPFVRRDVEAGGRVQRRGGGASGAGLDEVGRDGCYSPIAADLVEAGD